MPAKEETRRQVVQTLYWKELRRLLRDCGGIVAENGLDTRKIAAAAGTHHTTTRNLFDGTTLFPQFRTVWTNVAALGWKVALTERPRKVHKEIRKFARIGKKKRRRRKEGSD